MKWVISVNNMVYPLLLLLGKKGKNMIKFTKITTIKKYKKYRTNFVKPNDFYAKKKNASKKYDKQKSSKGKCFNYGKPRHYIKDCKQKPSKLKNKFNMLNVDDKDQEDLFRILESNNSPDSLKEDFSSSFDSCYQSTDESFGSPKIKIVCRDSCCNVIKTVNVLTKSEENESLLITLISQIENFELKQEFLNKLKKNLIKDENGKKLKSTISFEETLERFNKNKSKDLTINGLQHEITIVKREIIELKNEFKSIKTDNNNLKQEFLLLKIDKNLDKHQSDNEQDEHKDGNISSQQALLSDKGIANVFTNSQLNLVNKMLPPKWFTKVKIVVSHDYNFNVIAMIDSGVDMNCIQEGLIPSKYFENQLKDWFLLMVLK